MQRIFGESERSDRFSADQMFLNDAFKNFRRAAVIPGAFGIDDGDGTARADAEAVGLGAIDERVRAACCAEAFLRRRDEVQFLQPVLQKSPRGQSLFARAALRFGGIGAEENVAAEFFQAERLDGGLQLVFNLQKKFTGKK